MSDAFKDRQKGFEGKWAHDAEMRFKVVARRNKLLGLWAAGEMGLDDSKAKEYAMAVVQADFEEAGDEDVFRKVRVDLDASKSDSAIRAKMEELLTLAGEQIMSEAGK
jgi:hypothetical protein